MATGSRVERQKICGTIAQLMSAEAKTQDLAEQARHLDQLTVPSAAPGRPAAAINN